MKIRFLIIYIRLIWATITGGSLFISNIHLIEAVFFLICDLHNAESAGHGEEAKGNEDLDVHAWLLKDKSSPILKI